MTYSMTIVSALRTILVVLCTLAVFPALSISGAARAAEENTYTMKITLPTINDAPHAFAKNYAAAVETASRGRIKADVYPASQLGSIPRQIEGVQFGAIQCAVIPSEFFVGVDERFEVLAAPALVNTLAQAQRLAGDAVVLKSILGLGADKGLHGVGFFASVPSSVASRTPIRRLADFKAKRIRILASQFQAVALERLGATPVAMTTADVLPALQQGTLDAALGAVNIFTNMHYQDAAKFVTETNQSIVFLVIEISQKWFNSLPADLQQIVKQEAAAQSVAINPVAIDVFAKVRQGWIDAGGELVDLSREDQSAMTDILTSVGAEVSGKKPPLNAAYRLVKDAAERTR
jgi:TRAP-type C4-dicarboxylate transport system substrate-binding protein